MEFERKKMIKNKDKNNNKIKENNSDINGKILLLLKQNWEKIELEYSLLIQNFEKFNQCLLDSEMKKNYKSLILLLDKFKINFKKIFFNLGDDIGSLTGGVNNNYKINNNSNILKTSYDNINNEFAKIESKIKNINNIQARKKMNRKKQLENLELKLNEYMNEFDKIDYEKIDKLYDSYNNDKNEMENIILQNDFIEKYNYKEFEYQNENKDKKEKDKDKEKDMEIINNIMDIKTLNHDSESNTIKLENNKNGKIINEIVNMKEKNKDNAIKYIQSLINNSNSDQ